MCKLLSDSILNWGAVVAPAGDQYYKGLLARVSHLLRPGICNITSLLNCILNSAQIPTVKESRFFSDIPILIYKKIQTDTISIPYSEADDSLIQFISSLLKIEKIYFKYHLLELSQHQNKKLFKRVLLLVIKAILNRIASLQNLQNINREVKDLLTLYYFEGFLEIILIYDNYFSETEHIEPLFIFLENKLVQNYWINNVKLNYTCADYINKVANFIKANYTFSKQRVSANDTTKDTIPTGISIYNDLVNFYLSCDSKCREKLAPSISAMESYLYMIIKNHPIPDNDDIYDTLLDISKWHSAATSIRDEFYSTPHLQQDTGRGAYEITFSMLNHYCFLFLNNKIDNIESIPRILKSYLQKMNDSYSKMLDSNFKSLGRDKNGILSSKIHPVCSEDLCTRIISEMDTLIIGTPNQMFLTCEEDLVTLKHNFREFCKTGIPIQMEETKKIELRRGKQQLFYGFLCSLLGTHSEDATNIHLFLKATLNKYNSTGEDYIIKQATKFARNYNAYIRDIRGY